MLLVSLLNLSRYAWLVTKPVKRRPYRIPLAKREFAENEIKAMAEKRLIEPSHSAWSAPAVLVPKRDGTPRFCIDYRRLNQLTIPDSHPLPRIDDTLDALGGSCWFSTLDLKSGLHQVSIAEEDRPKTAFVHSRQWVMAVASSALRFN